MSDAPNISAIPSRRRAWVRWPACLTLLVGLVLVGCSSDNSSSSDDGVKRAEAKAAAKERALRRARDTYSVTSSELCRSLEPYLVSVFHDYADVLVGGISTVGEVKTEAVYPPLGDVGAAATLEAKQAVDEARRELAGAKAALNGAKRSAGRRSGEASSASAPATPLVPTTTANRVKIAASDFLLSAEGIPDQTPLAAAEEHFHAAAVALELSWLRLLDDGGCLTDFWRAQAESDVAEYTATLQRALARPALYQDEVDGVYGPTTVLAVQRLQDKHNLRATGAFDKLTAEALQSDLENVDGVTPHDASASIAAVQQILVQAESWEGPVDGNWTPALTKAIKEFQADNGVKPTGAIDSATLYALHNAIEALLA